MLRSFIKGFFLLLSLLGNVSGNNAGNVIDPGEVVHPELIVFGSKEDRNAEEELQGSAVTRGPIFSHGSRPKFEGKIRVRYPVQFWRGEQIVLVSRRTPASPLATRG